MSKNRVCATATGLSGEGHLDPNRMYYGRELPTDASEKILQIKGLARIGAAASDSMLTIDLEESGYLSLFEVIHDLCNEIWGEVDDLQHKAKVGIYSKSRKSTETANADLV